jgi:hypothetical protein
MLNEGLINKIRSILYTSAKVLGDVNAVVRGPDKIVKRIGRRLAGKQTAKVLNKIFK